MYSYEIDPLPQLHLNMNAEAAKSLHPITPGRPGERCFPKTPTSIWGTIRIRGFQWVGLGTPSGTVEIVATVSLPTLHITQGEFRTSGYLNIRHEHRFSQSTEFALRYVKGRETHCGLQTLSRRCIKRSQNSRMTTNTAFLKVVRQHRDLYSFTL